MSKYLIKDIVETVEKEIKTEKGKSTRRSTEQIVQDILEKKIGNYVDLIKIEVIEQSRLNIKERDIWTTKLVLKLEGILEWEAWTTSWKKLGSSFRAIIKEGREEGWCL